MCDAVRSSGLDVFCRVALSGCAWQVNDIQTSEWVSSYGTGGEWIPKPFWAVWRCCDCLDCPQVDWTKHPLPSWYTTCCRTTFDIGSILARCVPLIHWSTKTAWQDRFKIWFPEKLCAQTHNFVRKTAEHQGRIVFEVAAKSQSFAGSERAVHRHASHRHHFRSNTYSHSYSHHHCHCCCCYCCYY